MNQKNKDLYKKYLLKKHSGFKTGRDSIEKIVKKATKSKIKTIEKLIEGEVNEVYDIATESNQKIIVRISRTSRPNFETEKIYIDKVRELGVPAPKILLVERVKKNLTFCVEEKIEGTNFGKLKKELSEEENKKIINEAGKFLSRIHSVKVDGFGSLARSDKPTSWIEFIKQVNRNPDNPKLYYHKTVKQKNVDKAIQIIMKNIDLFRDVKPQLLHSDYGPKHWLVNNHKIVGILDFEGCKGGDPMYDFGWIHFFQGESLPIEWLYEGYENKELIKNNFDLKLKIYDLFLSLWLLDYYISEENISGINHCNDQLENGLKNFL